MSEILKGTGKIVFENGSEHGLEGLANKTFGPDGQELEIVMFSEALEVLERTARTLEAYILDAEGVEGAANDVVLKEALDLIKRMKG